MLNPVNDFYKRLALECSGQQIAVDLFVVNSQFVDLATISGISRFSGGSVHHFPLFKLNRSVVVDMFQREFRRYLTRKIGFEAVMRVRCTRGLAIHTFHGGFYSRLKPLLHFGHLQAICSFGPPICSRCPTLIRTQALGCRFPLRRASRTIRVCASKRRCFTRLVKVALVPRLEK